MQKVLGQEYSGIARKQFLRDNCDKVEEIGYMKQFSAQEILDMKEDLSEVSISLNDLEIRKKELMDQIKEEMKPLQEQKKSLLTNIKQKAVFVTEDCFKFVDQDEKRAAYFNAEGVNIQERPLRSDEYQLSMKMLTGTNN